MRRRRWRAVRGERAEAAYWSGRGCRSSTRLGERCCCTRARRARVRWWRRWWAPGTTSPSSSTTPTSTRARSTRYASKNKRYAQQLGIDFVDLDGDVVGGIDVDEWYKRAKGMEFCPERGARCSMCFDMRLERTALYAFENGFDSFSTTNATSRWKDEAQVNASGMKAASKYPGVEYWLSDWQGEEMTARKYKINAEQRFYKQEYCGCSYSLRDSTTGAASRACRRCRWAATHTTLTLQLTSKRRRLRWSSPSSPTRSRSRTS